MPRELQLQVQRQGMRRLVKDTIDGVPEIHADAPSPTSSPALHMMPPMGRDVQRFPRLEHDNRATALEGRSSAREGSLVHILEVDHRVLVVGVRQREGVEPFCCTRVKQQEALHPSYLREEVIVLVVVDGRQSLRRPDEELRARPVAKSSSNLDRAQPLSVQIPVAVGPQRTVNALAPHLLHCAILPGLTQDQGRLQVVAAARILPGGSQEAAK
mmetsp:Transcript_137629/g.439719  ORF Transcript_137629/g.439719 Transcript_137629/m.439719 type:complete len:214 (-) Transcript_137629:627-1268(-)